MSIADAAPPVGGLSGHVLLVSPLTFSYHVSISETLSLMGYNVTWWDDRASNAIWYKLALRLLPSLTARCCERAFLRRLRELNPSSITHVLVVKGEGLSRHVALHIRRTLQTASMGLYLWDGVENVKGVANILPAFDSVATFDPQDAQTLGWAYQPLFARQVAASQEGPLAVLYDWCFVGTIHSDRHRVIHRLRQQGGTQMRSFVFAFFQSPLVLALRKLTDWTLWVAPKGTLSTQSMKAADVAQIVRQSRAVLDVEHPRQRGFTMRTIETLLAGKKLVTTNEHILDSDLYHPSRAHVISRATPNIPAEFVAQPFAEIPHALHLVYSCEGWATKLLGLQDAARARRAMGP